MESEWKNLKCYTRFQRWVVHGAGPAPRQVGGVTHLTLVVVGIELQVQLEGLGVRNGGSVGEGQEGNDHGELHLVKGKDTNDRVCLITRRHGTGLELSKEQIERMFMLRYVQ